MNRKEQSFEIFQEENKKVFCLLNKEQKELIEKAYYKGWEQGHLEYFQIYEKSLHLTKIEGAIP